jgi:hypothetical protein
MLYDLEFVPAVTDRTGVQGPIAARTANEEYSLRLGGAT